MFAPCVFRNVFSISFCSIFESLSFSGVSAFGVKSFLLCFLFAYFHVYVLRHVFFLFWRLYFLSVCNCLCIRQCSSQFLQIFVCVLLFICVYFPRICCLPEMSRDCEFFGAMSVWRVVGMVCVVVFCRFPPTCAIYRHVFVLNN